MSDLYIMGLTFFRGHHAVKNIVFLNKFSSFTSIYKYLKQKKKKNDNFA